MLKTNPLLLKNFSVLLSNLRGDCLFTEAGKTQEMTKIFKKKLEKKASFVKKMLKFLIFKSWNVFHGT